MYEKQVHKDGIKRVLLSSDKSTARYFDQSELADLFKLAPPGQCSMLEKFAQKANNSASGSSGKPSFLSKHPAVLGVASHDALYTSIGVDVDLTSTATSAGSAEETPFTKSPFQKARAAGRHERAKDTQVIEVKDPSVNDENIKPLGGHNRTRQVREDAKMKRDKGCTDLSSTLSSTSCTVEKALGSADGHLLAGRADAAMTALLDVVENEIESISSGEKLSLHEKIAEAATLLGWL